VRSGWVHGVRQRERGRDDKSAGLVGVGARPYFYGASSGFVGSNEGVTHPGEATLARTHRP
jgi:hypothetical protein